MPHRRSLLVWLVVCVFCSPTATRVSTHGGSKHLFLSQKRKILNLLFIPRLQSFISLSLSPMANLKTDSPLSRRIVRAFLDFLSSVDPAPGADLEGLDVARECLAEVFQLPSAPHSNSDDLVAMFEAKERTATSNVAADSSQSSDGSRSRPLGENRLKEPLSVDATSKDELFGQFFGALEKAHFFKAMSNGNDDPAQLDKATRIFHDALDEMERSGSQEFNKKTLAEMLKCQGNRAMQSKLYPDAIDLYNAAIALCDSNAIYYCNRAAAYTQVRKYEEAIQDCLKSVEIDPNYSKAYSRLGLVYYAQGNYVDAIEKGFKKALQLDPSNESVKENIRVAEQKLRERQHHSQHQGMGPDQRNEEWGGSRSGGGPPPFGMPFDINLGSMFMNMAGGGQSQAAGGGEGVNGPEDPEIGIGGSVNLNIGDQMPEELSGALRSVMEMFSGAPPRGQNQGASGNGPATN